VPAIVFVDNAMRQDIAALYGMSVSCVYPKSVLAEAGSAKLAAICEHWLQSAILPMPRA
jgi:hypothetical protein